MNHPFLRFALLVLLLASTPFLHAQRERLTPEEIEIVDQKWPGTKKTSTGIRYLVLSEGSGPSPKPGDHIAVLYTGWLLDGKKFDESVDPEKPFAFRVGRSEVIPGWDHLLPAMKLNEKRLVIIPGSLAYGSRGRPPVIPRDAPLVFEMQLVKITPP